MALDIEEWSAIEAWKRGQPEPLVMWFAQQGKDLSPQLHQFLLDLLKKKKGKAGARKRSLHEWQIKTDILIEYLQNPSTKKTAIHAVVAQRHGLSVKRIEQILYSKKKPRPYR